MDRLNSLVQALGAPVLVTDPNSLYYYTRLATPGASFTCLIAHLDGRRDIVLRDLEVTNLWLTASAKKVVDAYGIQVHTYAEEDPALVVARLVQSTQSPVILGRESHAMSAHVAAVIARHLLKTQGVIVEWADVTNDLVWQRACKTHEEVECIIRAASYVAQSYKHALERVDVGVKERTLAGEFARGKACAGSEWAAYPDFVSSGALGCIGHKPACTTKCVGVGELLFTEIGASHGRYHAARMHAVCVGGTPPEWFAPLERALRNAVALARAACKDGAKAKDIDALMRGVVESEVNSLRMSCESLPTVSMQRRSGYSIGIGARVDWADAGVFLNPTSSLVLRTGMTLHLIPWIQLLEYGAMGFSDVVLVEEDTATSLFLTPQPSQYPRCAFAFTPPRGIDFEDLCAFADLTTPLPTLAERRDDLARLSTNPTPLLDWSESFSFSKQASGGDVHLLCKDERRRRVGSVEGRSIKMLGTMHVIGTLVRKRTLRAGRDTVASMSHGNHGEALAAAAKHFGVGCVILVPHDVSEERVARIRALGATVNKRLGTYDDCIVHLRTVAQANGWVVVSDTTWPGYDARIPSCIAEGYTTLFHEVLSQMPSPPDYAFVQAGDGGLLAAACLALPKATKLVCVEPADAACIYENVREERTVTDLVACSGTTNSDMQGLNCGVPSTWAYPMVQARVDAYVVLGDAWAHEAVQWLEDRGVSTNATGAAGVAGVMAARRTGCFLIPDDATVLTLVTEGVNESK